MIHLKLIRISQIVNPSSIKKYVTTYTLSAEGKKRTKEGGLNQCLQPLHVLPLWQ